jgi:pimeloyl-ACP methyl ester carboxylesterase
VIRSKPHFLKQETRYSSTDPLPAWIYFGHGVRLPNEMAIPGHLTIALDGVDLHVVDWREGGRDATRMATVLLLHGSAGNARIWDPVAHALAPHIPTLALDLRGHGNSTWPALPAYTCEDFTRDLGHVVDTLKLERVILTAHSVSVFHAIRYSANNSARVAGLVLVDIEATCRPEHKVLLNQAGSKPHPVFQSVEQAIAKQRPLAPFAEDAILASFVTSNLMPNAQSKGLTYRFDRQTLAKFDLYDEWHNLARLKCPVLLIYGRQSRLTRPDVMRRMAQAVPDARIAVIERAAHFPMLDNPAAFNDSVVSFCRACSGNI